MNKKNGKIIYHGLLECPLKSGYIEFEFSEGDRINELLTTIRERWGENNDWARKNGWHNNFGSGSGWLIACKDELGAYFVLDDGDLIPIRTPPSGDIFEVPTYREHPAGLRYPGDTENGVYNVEVFGYPLKRHLKFGFIRDYDIPLENVYDVRLIAIAAVTGG